MKRQKRNGGTTTLRDAIKSRLRAGNESTASAAKRLGVERKTFEAWIRENRFPEKYAKKAASLFNLGSVNDYEWETPQRSRAVRVSLKSEQEDAVNSEAVDLDALLELFQKRHEASLQEYFLDFNEDVISVFHKMHKGDIFVYLSFDELPIEASDRQTQPELIKALAWAIADGAYFIYIYPTAKAVEAASRVGVESNRKPQDFEGRLTSLRDTLTAMLKGRDVAVEKQVVFIPTDVMPFFMVPGHKYVYYHSSDSGTSPSKVQLCFAPYFRHYPQDKRTTESFLGIVKATFENAKRRDLIELLFPVPTLDD